MRIRVAPSPGATTPDKASGRGVYPLAADILLVTHFAVAGFIVGGLILIWIGALLRWAWVRQRLFRTAHLGAVLFVALEALAGQVCPLTLWEDLLRGTPRPESFVGRWVHGLLYYSAPEWLFTALYVAWAAATVATLYLVPARRIIP